MQNASPFSNELLQEVPNSVLCERILSPLMAWGSSLSQEKRSRFYESLRVLCSAIVGLRNLSSAHIDGDRNVLRDMFCDLIFSMLKNATALTYESRDQDDSQHISFLLGITLSSEPDLPSVLRCSLSSSVLTELVRWFSQLQEACDPV